MAGPAVSDDRDASRLLANASLAVQRALGIDAEPLLIEAGPDQLVAAAETWTNHQAPQVLVEGLPAVEARGTSTPEVTYTYETRGKPCLRLCKIADKSEAKPGEIVSFTLRFDNVGEDKINTVAIIDNLMPRLEYVVGSAQSSMKAKFSTQEVSGESLVLRWDIEEPLEVNAGGLVRFQARVR